MEVERISGRDPKEFGIILGFQGLMTGTQRRLMDLRGLRGSERDSKEVGQRLQRLGFY